jgi:hypothetical protein
MNNYNNSNQGYFKNGGQNEKFWGYAANKSRYMEAAIFDFDISKIGG